MCTLGGTDSPIAVLKRYFRVGQPTQKKKKDEPIGDSDV